MVLRPKMDARQKTKQVNLLPVHLPIVHFPDRHLSREASHDVRLTFPQYTLPFSLDCGKKKTNKE